jgi:hypothetical protein
VLSLFALARFIGRDRTRKRSRRRRARAPHIDARPAEESYA